MITRTETARSLKPARVVHRDWRGAQVRALGETATIKAHTEHHAVRDYTVAIDLLPAGAIVGDACIVRVIGAFPYTVAEIQSAPFAYSPGHDQAGAVARGEFHPGQIVYGPDETAVWW